MYRLRAAALITSSHTWVKHDTPPDAPKTDINALHQAGETLKITKMISSAQIFSESLAIDDEMLCRLGVNMILDNPFRAGGILGILEKKIGKGMRDIVKDHFKARTSWRNVYNSHIEDMWQNNSGVWVLFRRGEHPASDDVKQYPCNRVIEALRQYQTTKREVLFTTLDIPEKSTVYDISLQANPHPNQRNIFRGMPVLTERLDNSDSFMIPPMWDKVLDNLADAGEKAYLINHLATYVNTLMKPQTIIVLAGGFGTGKTKFMTLFAKAAFGKFKTVSNDDLISSFDDYLVNTPCIFIDELERPDKFQQSRVDAKLRYLINEDRDARIKHQDNQACKVKAYIAMAFNVIGDVSPLKIHPQDRRYVIIGGGHNRDLAACTEWWSVKEMEEQATDFIRYLRKYPYDAGKANRMYESAARKRLIGMSYSDVGQRILAALDGDPIQAQLTDGWIGIHALCEVINKSSRGEVQPKTASHIIKNELHFDSGDFWRKVNGRVEFNAGKYKTIANLQD